MWHLREILDHKNRVYDARYENQVYKTRFSRGKGST